MSGRQPRPLAHTDALPAPVVLAAAFVCGSVPFSNIAARLVRGVDLRDVGTGTVSGTALHEVAGFGPLAVAGVLEVAKGSVGPLLAGRQRPELARPGRRRRRGRARLVTVSAGSGRSRHLTGDRRPARVGADGRRRPARWARRRSSRPPDRARVTGCRPRLGARRPAAARTSGRAGRGRGGRRHRRQENRRQRARSS